MNDVQWTEHLRQWQAFLDQRLEQVDNPWERIKIRRQRRVLEELRYSAVLNPRLLLEFIHPTARPSLCGEPLQYTLALNDSQKRAVDLALSDQVLSLIQGPPGTGKTQVIAEICLQLFRRDPHIRILICSETHIAVNNLIARLAACSDAIRIVRIRDKEAEGAPDDHSPEAIIKGYAAWLRTHLENPTLAELIIETVSHYTDNSLEKALILSANVAGMTCNRVGAYRCSGPEEQFDVAIIDEVCKATLPEILMPLAVARKAILVGDPRQLPPVFCSEEREIIRSIEHCHLQEHMYIDRLFSRSRCVTLLDTQYRMAPCIGALVGTLFYGGELKNGRASAPPGRVQWLDYTPSRCWPPVAEEEHPQIYNLDECAIVAGLIRRLDRKANRGQSVAVIAPYRSQVGRLREILRAVPPRYVETRVDTVDGFQGKESDIVVFSLTRTHGSFRFLADDRRLNVALSRARDQLYMVGALRYARTNPLLDAVVGYCEIQTVSPLPTGSEDLPLKP